MEEKTKTKTTTTTKITVMKQAELLLDEMLAKTNDGFSGGQITRQDLASWVVGYFHSEAFAHCLERIRADHFDQLAHMEAILRHAKEARKRGADAAEIAAILSSPGSIVRNSGVRRSRRSEVGESPIA